MKNDFAICIIHDIIMESYNNDCTNKKIEIKLQ